MNGVVPWDGVAATRAEVLEVIDQLLSGQMTREEASAWAGPRSVYTDDETVNDAVELLFIYTHRHFDQGQDLDYMWTDEDLREARAALLDEF